MDVSDMVEIALDNGFDDSNVNDILSFGSTKKEVNVRLEEKSPGYSHKFFADVEIKNKEIKNIGGVYFLNLET